MRTTSPQRGSRLGAGEELFGSLRWPVLMGSLLALSPLSGVGRVWLSALLGFSAGAAIYLLQRWREHREGIRQPPPAVWGRPGLPTCLALGALALAFLPTLLWLFEEHTASVWRTVHGLFVPVFAALLARSRLRADPHPERSESSAWGFAFLISGLTLAVLDAGVRSHYLAAIGLLLCLPGVSLLLLGARRTRQLVVPMALCVFVLPFPAYMGDPFLLTRGTAVLAESELHAFGVPTLRHGSVFITRAGLLGVGQNCSGLSALHASIALSFLLAFCARGWRRRALLLLLPYPLVLVLNSFRCALIVAATHYTGPDFLASALHGLSGLALLWASLFALWLCADHAKLKESLS